MLHVGDLSYANGHPEIWDSFLEGLQPFAARIPYMVAVGNHEVRRKRQAVCSNARQWQATDSCPASFCSPICARHPLASVVHLSVHKHANTPLQHALTVLFGVCCQYICASEGSDPPWRLTCCLFFCCCSMATQLARAAVPPSQTPQALQSPTNPPGATLVQTRKANAAPSLLAAFTCPTTRAAGTMHPSGTGLTTGVCTLPPSALSTHWCLAAGSMSGWKLSWLQWTGGYWVFEGLCVAPVGIVMSLCGWDLKLLCKMMQDALQTVLLDLLTCR